MDYTRLLKVPNVQNARRSIVHINSTDRDFVIIYDYTHVPAGTSRVWNLRLHETPIIAGLTAQIPRFLNRSQLGMNMSVLEPANASIQWVGGKNNEMIAPDGTTWMGNKNNGYVEGYSDNASLLTKAGLGNIY